VCLGLRKIGILSIGQTFSLKVTATPKETSAASMLCWLVAC